MYDETPVPAGVQERQSWLTDRILRCLSTSHVERTEVELALRRLKFSLLTHPKVDVSGLWWPYGWGPIPSTSRSGLSPMMS
jgi:hypothetical protein